MANSPATLTLRTVGTEVQITNPVAKAAWYHAYKDDKPNVKHRTTYYEFASDTNPDEVTLADIRFATLLDGRPSADAAQSIANCPVPIIDVPHEPLRDLGSSDLDLIAETLLELYKRHGWGSAVSTKVLHKKRPAAVPVLDSKAIFGSYT